MTNNTEVHDNVDHPAHYQGKNECIDVMIAMFGIGAVKSFCKCNAYKYRFRADKKNGAEDIAKAEWYETKLIELDKRWLCIKIFVVLTIIFFITTVICLIGVFATLKKFSNVLSVVDGFETLFNNTICYINSFMSEDDTKKVLYNALKLQSNGYNVSLPDNYLEDTANQIYEEIINGSNSKEVK